MLTCLKWRLVFQDTVVFRQQTQGEGPGEAAQFFYLNPDTGVISTKKFLTETTTKTFRVRSVHGFIGVHPWLCLCCSVQVHCFSF